MRLPRRGSAGQRGLRRAYAQVRAGEDRHSERARAEAARLGVTRNNAYVLILDAAGREYERLMDEGGRRPIKPAGITAAMRRVLGGSSSPAEGFDLLVRMADSADPGIRRERLHLMGGLETRHDEAVRRLVEALADTEGPSSPALAALAAVRSLARLGPAAAGAVPHLRRLALERELPSNLRQAAAMALGKVDPSGALQAAAWGPARRVIDVLREALHEDDASVVIGAAIALGDFGPAAAPALPDLLARLAGVEGPAARLYIVKALGNLGALAAPALPRLDQIAAET